MRLLKAPPAILSFVALLLTKTQPTTAGPFSRLNEIIQQEVERLLHDDDDALSLQNSTLELKRRQTAAVCNAGSFNCGYYGQVCCVSGSQTCATNAAGEAYCADVSGGGQATAVSGGSGQWQLYTSIWTTTGAITMTSIYSSYITAAATGSSSGNCVPNYANNESGCGKTCCSSGQYCYDPNAGICKPAGNGGYTTTGITNSPPTRATTSNGVIYTLTMTPTTTVPYNTPIATGQNGTAIPTHKSGGGGLSGGAIAGIVIGVIAGLILLFLICLCWCLRAGFDGILALLGLGNRNNRRRRVVEEEYVDVHRRYGSQAGSGRRWYGSAAGGRPGRPGRPPSPPQKRRGLGNLGAIGLGLGGLAIALGLKRRYDRKHEEEKSDISSSYYDSYYYSSTEGSQSRRGGSRI